MRHINVTPSHTNSDGTYKITILLAAESCFVRLYDRRWPVKFGDAARASFILRGNNLAVSPLLVGDERIRPLHFALPLRTTTRISTSQQYYGQSDPRGMAALPVVRCPVHVCHTRPRPLCRLPTDSWMLTRK